MRKSVIVNKIVSKFAVKLFEGMGYHVIKLPENPNTYKEIAGHPDINCFVYDGIIYLSNHCFNKISREFAALGYKVVNAGTIGDKYPNNTSLNGMLLEGAYIHKLSCTSIKLLDVLGNVEKINVNQGYTKCSCAIVDNQSFITSDKGIYEGLKEKFDILLIRPGYVELEGFEYGFIGGASGMADDFVFFYGNVKEHPDYEDIKLFVEERGKKLVYIPNQSLEDVGSFFFLESSR